jgi:molybdopterin/thiamine biosynthesis adenylyltransferase
MKLPRLKPLHNAYRLPSGNIRVGGAQFGVATELEDGEEGQVWALVGLLDGTRSIDAIVADHARLFPDFDGDSVRAALAALIEAGFVEDAGGPPPDNLTPDELERYARSAHYFSWADVQPRTSPFEIQGRLKAARVSVLGLGGTGSSAAMALVASGVGAVQCVDFDRVEATNLTRQILYLEDDVGRPKVERAVARLRRLNPRVEVTGRELKVESSAHVLELMEGRDLFVLCADLPRQIIEHWVSDAAVRSGTPWVVASYAGPMLVCGFFIPGTTPCWRCFMHAKAQRDAAGLGGATPLFPPLETNAVIAPTAAIAGNFAALEAIYFLARMRPQTVGRIFHQNFIRYDHTYSIEAPRWPECPACNGEAWPLPVPAP